MAIWYTYPIPILVLYPVPNLVDTWYTSLIPVKKLRKHQAKTVAVPSSTVVRHSVGLHQHVRHETQLLQTHMPSACLLTASDGTAARYNACGDSIDFLPVEMISNWTKLS